MGVVAVLQWLFGVPEEPLSGMDKRSDAHAHLASPPSQSPTPAPRGYAIDVETTGLSSTDRIVSLGMVELNGLEPTKTFVYLAFDPGKKSHPQAERLHGFTDWELRHQRPFAEYALSLHQSLSSAGILVGHNIAFDLDFLNREFALAGLPPLDVPTYCTMRTWRTRFPGRRSSLDACARAVGMTRESAQHSAIEDAAIAAYIYARLEGWTETWRLAGFDDKPARWIDPPPLPDKIPRRKSLKSKFSADPNNSSND